MIFFFLEVSEFSGFFGNLRRSSKKPDTEYQNKKHFLRVGTSKKCLVTFKGKNQKNKKHKGLAAYIYRHPFVFVMRKAPDSLP